MLTYCMIAVTATAAGGCRNAAKPDETLAAHNATELVRQEWTQVEKPLEIVVEGRSREELTDIGSMAVWFDGIGGAAVEFHFDGEAFRPLSSVMADSTVSVMACHPFRQGLTPADTLRVTSPMEQWLVGTVEATEQTRDKIRIRMKLQDINALLRLKLQSDNIEDVLHSIAIDGLPVTGELMPLLGEWIAKALSDKKIEKNVDCLLNNGVQHDLLLPPGEEARDVAITVTVDGKPYKVATTLPPLRPGSLTELRLNLADGKLSVGSSWVDTKHPYRKKKKERPDSVKVGQFLQFDGTISEVADSNSLAMVVETDGRHGKAVALRDNADTSLFGRGEFQTGKVFDTVDGQHREGCFHRKLWEDYNDEAEVPENFIEFDPKVRYAKSCALGVRRGCEATRQILLRCDDDALDLFWASARLTTAYIPSLYELAKLAFFIEANGQALPKEFVLPLGPYGSCCESGDETFYTLDPSICRITAHNSKNYGIVKLRLFYLF